jgi:nudix-type nucleoside diphosphatase (YffH/AdpP family)
MTGEEATSAGQAGRAGIERPDHRGRTGLDRAGRDLNRNRDVVVREVELVAAGWHVLRSTVFERRRRDGRWVTERRETYDRGNGAVVLPYDTARGTVLLTRQFRFPAYVNDHPDGMLLEAAAGLLDADDPETAVRREAEEELGVRLGELTHVYDVYMSPGSVTERLHFFAAPYLPGDRVGPGGGLAEDGEDIEVVEVPFTDALAMVRDGRIADGKTIMLLHWAALEGPFATPAAGTAPPAGG